MSFLVETERERRKESGCLAHVSWVTRRQGGEMESGSDDEIGDLISNSTRVNCIRLPLGNV